MSKVILVTGGNRGIGAATVKLASKKGYAVCINYNKDKLSAERLRNEIIASGGDALTIQADIGIEDDVIRLFQTVKNEFACISGFVNNAGIITPRSRLVDMDIERLRRIFNINIMGSFICAREAVKHMSTDSGGEGGSIVNLSSAAARIGSPNEFIDYAASKGAIDTMTLGLAKEVAEQGIRVNAVRPGLISTELHADTGDVDRPEKLKQHVPMKRAGTAEEVANMIVWLLSDEASYVTGSLFDVTGGR